MEFFRLTLLLPLLFMISCARAPIKDDMDALREARRQPFFQDDMGFEGLKGALEINIERLKGFGGPLTVMRFGPFEVSRQSYVDALKVLVRDLEVDPSGKLFLERVQKEFRVLEVYGIDRWSEVFVTGYFEPVYQGRRSRTGRFTHALHKKPKDLVRVDLTAYEVTNPTMVEVRQLIRDKVTREGILRGRVVQEDNRVLLKPYFSRKEIVQEATLKGKGLELYYLDPIDAFFLHIQGSGRIDLGRGQTVLVGYAGQNGHPYRAIGQDLIDFIPIEEMSLQKIEAHLRSLPLEEALELMSGNASYIFFEARDEAAVTFFGVPAVPGRSIATDSKYFPKGALGFLEFQKPVIDDEAEDLSPTDWEMSRRFVLDHDVGGAIRGPGRVDLFTGSGPRAGAEAGPMRHKGRLFYLVPK